MTMYNEDDSLFTRTMHGVMKNIAYLCKRDRSKTWGKDGWKKVVVCIVSDGRQKINSRTLSVIAAIGAYQEGIARNVVNGKPVTAHIYEYTTQSASYVDILSYLNVLHSMQSLLRRPTSSKARRKVLCPCRSSFVSRRKIRRRSIPIVGSSTPLAPFSSPMFASCSMSVRCLVQARFIISGRRLISTLTLVALAVKSSPSKANTGRNSLILLVRLPFLSCKSPPFDSVLVVAVAAQNFEYKMSNILDKPLYVVLFLDFMPSIPYLTL